MWVVNQRDLGGLDSYFSLHIRESGKGLLVESGILGFGIRNTAQGIRNPTKDWNLESGIHGLGSRIQDFFDSLHEAIVFFSESTLRLKKSYFPLFTGVDYYVFSFIHRDLYIKKTGFFYF